MLRGWNAEGGEARHDLTLLDLRVRNVPTAVHGRTGDQTNSNSIFVFEVADLCIAHLGHLHQLLTDQQLAELGSSTWRWFRSTGRGRCPTPRWCEVICQIRPAVVIPMHYFGSAVLGRFLDLIEEEYGSS